MFLALADSGRAARARSATARARAGRTAPAPATSPDIRAPSRPERSATSRSSSAVWQPRNRRRCAVSQPLKAGLRSISRPSRKSPANSAAGFASRSACDRLRCPGAPGRSRSHRRSSPPDRAVWCPPGVSTRAPIRLVDQRPDLAEAPAKLAARIVGDIPQQLAELAPGNRRAGQAPDRRTAHAPCATPAGPARRRPAGSSAAQASVVRGEADRFHGHFHAVYHVRLHVWPLRLKSTVTAHATPGILLSPSRPQDQGPHDQGPQDQASRHDSSNGRTRGSHGQSKLPTASTRSAGRQTAPAGAVVLRRLCRCRHHVADRGGATVVDIRSDQKGRWTSPPATFSRPRSRPALVRCGRHGLRAGTALPRRVPARSSSAGT